jgi:hypothetical protein
LYASPDIVRVINPRRMRWVEHVARVGEIRIIYRIFVGNPEGRDHLEDIDLDWKVLVRILHKWVWKLWAG